MTETFEHGYALLIGVGDCQDSRLSLPVTVKDTQAIKKVLIDSNSCGYLESHINILNNEKATKKGILDGLKWLKEKAENDSEATIFIYYSGHGGLKDDNYYLIPHDYVYSEDNPLTTALSSEELTNALRKIDAKRLLVVIDSCHAAGMATSNNGDSSEAEATLQAALKNLTLVASSKGLIETLTRGEGRAVFTSSKGEEFSWIKIDESMSIYTCHFCEVLKGMGNQVGDKEVKLSDLMGYLSDKVPKTALQDRNAKQTPYFDMGSNDFAIAVLQNNPLPSEDIIYVERSPIETQACQANCKPGSLIRIKAPQKMGKTLLLNQILKDASNKGFKTVIFDFGLLTDEDYEDYEEFLKDFCFSVRKELQLDSDKENKYRNDLWEKEGSKNKKACKFFEDYILGKISVDLVLALENFDQVLEEEKIRDNFCKLLRYWFDISKRETNTIWDKLHLIIIHSTDVYGSMDIHSSPLAGVGEDFELMMFNDDQIKKLIAEHDITLNDNIKQQLIDLIGGHPYLLVKAIKALKKQNITLTQLLEEAVTESGIFRDHLCQLLKILDEKNDLKEAYKKVVNSDKSVKLLEPKYIAFSLYSLGLVQLEGDMGSPRNNLYKEYFKKHLI